MPILGIDYEKCINCGTCLITCGRYLFKEGEQDIIIHEDPLSHCNQCGHCIAICPESAILHEGMGDSNTYEGVNNPETFISYENIYKFFQVHRSIRRYKKDKIPIELLQKVFNAMQLAPTARNMRSETFSIISEKEKIKALSDAVKNEVLNDPRTRDLYEVRLSNLEKEFDCPIFYDAPHVIFVSSQFKHFLEDNNIGIIITYGRLAASALGLGTCWIGLTSAAMQFNPKIMKLANIRGKTVGVFTIGYPDVTFYSTAPRFYKKVKGLK